MDREARGMDVNFFSSGQCETTYSNEQRNTIEISDQHAIVLIFGDHVYCTDTRFEDVIHSNVIIRRWFLQFLMRSNEQLSEFLDRTRFSQDRQIRR